MKHIIILIILNIGLFAYSSKFSGYVDTNYDKLQNERLRLKMLDQSLHETSRRSSGYLDEIKLSEEYLDDVSFSQAEDLFNIELAITSIIEAAEYVLDLKFDYSHDVLLTAFNKFPDSLVYVDTSQTCCTGSRALVQRRFNRVKSEIIRQTLSQSNKHYFRVTNSPSRLKFKSYHDPDVLDDLKILVKEFTLWGDGIVDHLELFEQGADFASQTMSAQFNPNFIKSNSHLIDAALNRLLANADQKQLLTLKDRFKSTMSESFDVDGFKYEISLSTVSSVSDPVELAKLMSEQVSSIKSLIYYVDGKVNQNFKFNDNLKFRYTLFPDDRNIKEAIQGELERERQFNESNRQSIDSTLLAIDERNQACLIAFKDAIFNEKTGDLLETANNFLKESNNLVIALREKASTKFIGSRSTYFEGEAFPGYNYGFGDSQSFADEANDFLMWVSFRSVLSKFEDAVLKIVDPSKYYSMLKARNARRSQSSQYSLGELRTQEYRLMTDGERFQYLKSRSLPGLSEADRLQIFEGVNAAVD